MLAFRALLRVATVTALCVVIVSAYALPVFARARLIAVVIFRSTAASHHDAVLASKSLAAVLAQEPGWDAKAINAGGKSPADAAAAAGAEIYVIGQYVPGKPARVTGATYRVATDERLGDFSFALSDGRTVPSSVSFASVATKESSDPTAATPSPPAQATSNEEVVVPRGTTIVVAMDHEMNSYSAASREPISYTVAQDVVLDGHVVAKAGDEATGIVLEAQQGNQGGLYGIGWKAANLRVDVEAVHNFCGDTIPMEFIRSEYRRRQGLFGSHQDLEIVKGQKYIARVAHTIKVCGATTSEDPLTPPSDALSPDDAQPPTVHTMASIQPVQAPTESAPTQSAPAQLAKPADIGEIYEPQPQPSAPAATHVVVPPSHWIEKQASSTNDVATLGYWVAPSSSYETFQVVTQNIPGSMLPSQYADMTMRSLENAIGAKNVRAFRTEQICDGRANGWYIESSVTSGATSVITEQTLGVTSGASYIATYRRPANSPEDTAARQALDTLCPQAA